MPWLEMHELDAGVPTVQLQSSQEQSTETTSQTLGKAFHGQLGFIGFTTAVRLPRHVHIGSPSSEGKRSLVTERILVLNGVALVELNGEVYVIPDGALVTIGPGVPHTWTACPAGVLLPDGYRSTGRFLMVYQYAEQTAFFPTDCTETLASAEQYVEYKGDLDAIRFPQLSADEVISKGKLVYGKEVLVLAKRRGDTTG
ncbi:hypothetical protein H2200_005207 [Cladophialophora chaetospira]|uniref:Uncharacterized protein n=1 Tax=Cladophialophora chaetospira TaxID=386627 RepID=A0AA38XBJ6_9EURO|nr:hypothetical protein H2200_005207 [Cladophialophora chaetospira]